MRRRRSVRPSEAATVPQPNSNGIGKSRKAERKMARKLKKLGRVAYAKHKPVEEVIRENFASKNSKKKKKRQNEESDEEMQELKRKKQESDSEDDISYEEYLQQVKDKKKQVSIGEMNKEDDLAIHRYSRLLGLQKKKAKIPKVFKNDGLDVLLEFCDAENRDELVAMEKEIEDGQFKEEEDNSGNEENDENPDDINLSEGSSGEDEELSDEDFEDEASPSEQDSDGENGNKEEVVEDIYGRKINKKTRELIDFNPQAARQKLAELESKGDSDETKLKIDRNLTGLINRLTESTLVKTKQAIEELWRTESKNVIKQSLYRILSKIIGSPFRVQNQLIYVYTALLSLLNSSVNQEITAYFVEYFVCDLVKSLENEGLNEDDKSRDNKAIFLANLCNFKIIGFPMIFDVVDRFAKDLNIDKLQMILTILSHCYKSLKKKCAQQMQDRITQVLSGYEKAPFSEIPRSKFIAEQLGALRKQQPVSIDFDEIERLNKMILAICKREKGGLEKELGMSLDDLLMAEERGRWWIVGSAFRLPTDSYNEISQKSQNKSLTQFPPEMLQLAEKVGMKTELRKQIFCLIGNSEDEDEAFERLIRLSLKGQQERELVYVLMAMSLREKKFNPFYPDLMGRFCNYNRRFNLTVQFAVWDRWKEAGALSAKGQANFAALIHYLLVKEVQPITLLKVVDWGLLTKTQSVMLLKLFQLLGETPKNVLKKVFAPLFDEKKASKLTLLFEGMRVWLSIHLKTSPVLQILDVLATGLQ